MQWFFKYSFSILLVNVLISVGNVTFGQKITYKCYIFRDCDKKIEAIKDFYLLGNNVAIYPDSLTNEILLSDTGNYILYHFNPILEDNGISINIKYGENADTFKAPNLVEVDILDSRPPKEMPSGNGWLYCDKLANGFIIDFYNNGSKRIEGEFKKGLPVGDLKFYEQDNTLYRIKKYNKHGKLMKDIWLGN